MFRSIRAKFITAYSFITIAFIVILLNVLYITERERLLNIALEKSLELSKLHANLVSSEFRQYVTALKAISGQSRVIEGDIPYTLSELNRLIAIGNGAFHNATLVDKEFNNTDASGNTVSMAGSDLIKDPRWYSAGFNVTPPIIGHFNKIPSIAVGVPILNKNNEWQGTITVAVALDYLSQRLSSITLGKGSYAWLAGANGVVITHPDKSLVMGKTTYEADNIGFSGFTAIAKKSRGQDVGYGEYFDERNNEDKIVTFSKVGYLPGWTLFVTSKKSEIFADINTILMDILVTSLILMGIFLLVIIKLTNNITQPIIQLTRTAKDSIKNRFKPITVMTASDEIGQLSRAFARTIKQVHHYTHNLAAIVEKRTMELNHANQELLTANTLLNEKNRELENMASTDPLTQLYNRRAFNIFVEKEMSRAARHGSPVALILMDIDHFKDINDSYGHDVGDNVLSQLATLLNKHTRKENVICRWGGEEFVILIAEASSEIAVQAMQELKEKISKAEFGPVKSLTVSAGVASYRPGEPFKEWINRADIALYDAKNSGRNCVKKA